MAAYERALAIDPLQQSAVRNLAVTAAKLNDQQTVDRLLQRITEAGGSPFLIGSVKADQLYLRGDYSGAVRTLRQLGFDAKGHSPRVLWNNWLETLTGLGYYESLHAITDCPDWYAPLLRGKILPPETFGGRAVLPEEFWTSMFFSSPASRAMVNLGHSDRLVRLYRAGFKDADEFISVTGRQDLLSELAPTLAVALASTGAREEARYLLATAGNRMEPAIRRPGNRDTRASLAAIRAAQGERTKALALLDSAIGQGWLPDGRNQALDLAQEPAFQQLRGDARFEALRKRVLSRIARERAELGPFPA